MSSSMEFSGNFRSRQLIIEEVMEALNDDNVSIIGVCGMRGVGKTTLVSEIGKQAKEGKLYDVVVMVAVSHTPSIQRIQGDIANRLGGCTPSDNSESAREILWERIKEEKHILVILDDVSERIRLEEIGIPFGKDHGGCKIVLTSQRKTICEEMGCQKISTVGTLSKQESWIIFKENVGLDVQDIDISPIAREVAANCGGLPIAIVIIARVLMNKDKSIWIDAAQQLKKLTLSNIEGIHEKLISSLKLSCNYLESEAKSLFLFCFLFPEDSSILIEDLVRYGTGLRWLQDLETLEDVRARTHNLVSTLVSFFLLTVDEDDNEFIKMHKFVRDVAQMIEPIYNRIFMIKAGSDELQEWSSRDSVEKLTGISLMSNDIQKVPNRLECPKLQTLLLQENYELVVPENFFQGKRDLKILDLSGAQLLPLPESLSLLANLRTLYLKFCKLGDLSVIGELSNLEILSLFHSNVEEIPISFNKLSHLRLLDLKYCRHLKLIPHGVISCLHKLEELYMIESFRHWDFEGKGDSTSNARLVEFQNLSRLTSLQIDIPNPSMLPNEMSFPFQNLKNFILDIGISDYYWDTSSYLRNKKVSLRISKVFDWIKNLLKSSEELYLSELTELKDSLHDLVNEGFIELKSLTIESCQLKYLLNGLESTPNLIFHNLEKLNVRKNPNLVEICHGQLQAQSFSKLKILVVNGCNMSTIVPSHLLQRLQNLESFEANDCKLVAYIFGFEGLAIANGETKMLSSLKYLLLVDLPEMEQIWKGDHQFINICNLKSVRLYKCQKLIELFSPALLQSSTCLEELKLNDCDNLEEIFGTKEVMKKKANSIISTSLGNLTSIIIYNCNKLKTLFTPTIAKSLAKLRRLELSKCSTIQEIITNEVEKKEGIKLPSLYMVKLGFLNSLICFSSGFYSIEYPALEKLEIYKCPKMKIFGDKEQVTPKLKEVQLEFEGHWMGNVNDTIQQFFNEQTAQEISQHQEKEKSKILSTGFYVDFESRKSIMEEIIEALDDENVNLIGILGMGGVGKTTLMKGLCEQAKESKLYDAVVMVVVCQQTPNILKIQGDIANALGLNLSDVSKSARPHSIRERIVEVEQILVILDNVMEIIKLEEIGIPFGNDHRGCKIVLTSQSEELCDQMNCQKIFTIETLLEIESWELFRELAGLEVKISDINQIARHVAARCGGLPIAIVTVARALKNKSKHEWLNTAWKLRKFSATNIQEMDDIVISSLLLSYSYLESDAKSLFLFCSLFPEDFKIPTEVLVRYGIGLRWFENSETIEAVRDRVQAVVSTLTSSFLLVDDNDDDGDYVKMHDVVRDFALILARKDKQIFMMKIGNRLQEWPAGNDFENLADGDLDEDLTIISLISSEIEELPDELIYPELQALLLQKNCQLVVPKYFFKGMADLKVLDLSQLQHLLLPESLSLLVYLRTLYLNDCKLSDLSVIGKLINLEVLSLSGSDIREIPMSFSQLSSLRLLDLNYCKELPLVSYGAVHCLHKLEELYMVNSYMDWDFKRGDSGNNVPVKVQPLCQLNSLQIYIPNPEIVPNNMPFQNISSFTLIIGYLTDNYWDKRRYSRSVMLSHTSKVFDWLKILLKRTENLYLDKVDSSEDILVNFFKEDLHNLKSLTIKSCSIKYLTNTQDWTPSSAFHNLEKLLFYQNANLLEICHGQLPSQSFNELRILDVHCCHSMAKIAPSHLLQRLQNLECVKVSACKSVEDIFDSGGFKTENGETKLLSSLKGLHLIMLPKMKPIWKGDEQIVSLHNLKQINLEHCPKLIKLFSSTLLQSLNSLEKLEVSYCINLTEIFGKKVAEKEERGPPLKKEHTKSSRNLGNLTYIAISYCYKLENLFNPSIVKRLVQLKTLKLSHCLTIQEIVANEKGEKEASTKMVVFHKGEKEASTKRIVFPRLHYMELEDLGSLTCFYPGIFTLEFSALQILKIYECPKMKAFGCGDLVTPKLNKVCLKNVGLVILKS